MTGFSDNQQERKQKMTAEKMDQVRYFLKDILLTDAIPDDYRGHIVEEILPDVCADIDAAADKEFSDGDVRLALGRVLMSRIGIEV